MHKRHVLAAVRLGFAALALTAIVVQLLTGLAKPNFSIANFFSFFTIESNLLAACLLLVSAWGALKQKRSAIFALARGAAVLYMTTTGIVYALLLSGLEASLQMTLPWVNIVLHYIMPIAVLTDWLVDKQQAAIAFKRALVWVVFPFTYLIYSLIRGHIVGWYPYPFLSPSHGYARVLVACIFIALAMVGLTWLLSGITRWRPRTT